MKIAVLCLACLLAAPATAQDLDCADAQTTREIETCAKMLFEAADGDLNDAYRMARARTREMDGIEPGLDPSNEVMLRDAQRLWLPYRDAACAAESNLGRGGSIQNTLYLFCLERLTRQRTEDLRFFGEVN